MDPKYIETDPQSDIFFKVIPGKNSINILKMKNLSKKRVAYKIKTTNPKAYVVKPNQGIIQPEQKLDIEFSLQQKDIQLINPNIMDKFMIKAIEIENNLDLTKSTDIFAESSKQNQIQFIKIRANLLKEGSGGFANTHVYADSPLQNKSELKNTNDMYNSMGNENSRLSHINNLGHKDLDKLMAKVEDQDRLMVKISEERNNLFAQLTTLKENAAQMINKQKINGFQLWQVILVSIVCIIIGAFLSAP